MLAPTIIIAFAIAYTLFSVALQRKLVNMQRVYEIQDVMKQKTKELTEMSKNNAGVNELKAKQAELMKLTSESMKNQIKPMIVIFPIFIVVYYLLLPMFLPALGITAGSTIASVFSIKLNYRSLFILALFISGFVSSFGLMAVDRSRRKKAKAMQQAVQMQQ